MIYNTSRKKLALPEYGRNIQKLVDFALSIEDDTKRNRVAKNIITIIGNKNPHLRDIENFKHKLWEHLAIMSDFKLKIDYPFEIPKIENFQEKPNKIPYKEEKIIFHHYGKIIEFLIEKAISLENIDEKRKEELTETVANQMKKSYLMWNSDEVNEETILQNLHKLSRGRLKLKKDFKFIDAKNIVKKHKKKRQSNRRYK